MQAQFNHLRWVLRWLKPPSDSLRVCYLPGCHRLGQLCHGDDLHQAPCNPEYTFPHNRRVISRYVVDCRFDNLTATGDAHTVDVQMRASPWSYHRGPNIGAQGQPTQRNWAPAGSWAREAGRGWSIPPWVQFQLAIIYHGWTPRILAARDPGGQRGVPTTSRGTRRNAEQTKEICKMGIKFTLCLWICWHMLNTATR